MKLRLVGGHELPSLASAWSALEPEVAFARPEWVIPFADTFGGGLRFVPLVAELGRELVGVLPMMEVGDWPLLRGRGRALLPLHNEHTPELALAVAADHRTAVLDALLGWTARAGGRLAALGLGPLRVDGATYAAAASAARRATTLAYERCEHHTHHTDVGTSFDAFLGARSKNFRKQVRKAERAAARHGLTVERLDDEESFEAALPELARVSQASWQGDAGSGTFGDAVSSRFYRAMTRAFLGRGWGRVLLCRRDGVVVGFVLYLVDGATWHALKSEMVAGLDDLMIGWQIARTACDAARGEGARTITSGTWVTEFKQRWTTRSTPVSQLAFFTPRSTGVSTYLRYLGAELVKRRLERPTVARCAPWTGFRSEAR